MVAAHDVGVYFGVLNMLQQTLGGDEVVDAPAGILLAGMEAVAPPGVGDLVGIERAEGVDESLGEELAEFLALLIGEAGIAAVGLGVLDVNLLMGHVEVAAVDDGLLAVKALQVVAHGVFPCHPVVEALQPVLGVGGIAAYEEELGHLERDDAAFVVVLVDADAVGHVERLVAGEDGCSGIAFLVGGVPVALVAFELEVELSGLHLCLLQAEEVGVELAEDVAEAFALTGAEAVDVPRYQFHIVGFKFQVSSFRFQDEG